MGDGGFAGERVCCFVERQHISVVRDKMDLQEREYCIKYGRSKACISVYHVIFIALIKRYAKKGKRYD